VTPDDVERWFTGTPKEPFLQKPALARWW
jgi:hypothetical protein